MSTQLYLANKKRKSPRKVTAVTRQQLESAQVPGYEEGVMLDSQYLLISALLPPTVKEFLALCEREVEQLCGKRHARDEGLLSRWGTQRGSIQIAGQQVAVKKPRVRGPSGERELETYAQFQDSKPFDQKVFQEGLRKVSQRDYEKGLPKIAASFGMSKSKVSRSWVNATERQLEKLRTRNLSALGIVGVFIDGKRFAKLGVIVALGVGSSGHKHVLAIYQCSTENSAACRALLDDLERRGLPEGELLFVVDGGSGLNKALNEKYQTSEPSKRRAARVRCYVHKWRNLEEVLTEKQREEAAPLFWAIREARDLTQAMECAHALERVLGKCNASALASFLEARRIYSRFTGSGSRLSSGVSSRPPTRSRVSTLCSRRDLRRVKRWRDSAHFQRWLATACLTEREAHEANQGLPSSPGSLGEAALAVHERKRR